MFRQHYTLNDHNYGKKMCGLCLRSLSFNINVTSCCSTALDHTMLLNSIRYNNAKSREIRTSFLNILGLNQCTVLYFTGENCRKWQVLGIRKTTECSDCKIFSFLLHFYIIHSILYHCYNTSFSIVIIYLSIIR